MDKKSTSILDIFVNTLIILLIQGKHQIILKETQNDSTISEISESF